MSGMGSRRAVLASVVESIKDDEGFLVQVLADAPQWVNALWWEIHRLYPPRGMDMIAPHAGTNSRFRVMVGAGKVDAATLRKRLTVEVAFTLGGQAALTELVRAAFEQPGKHYCDAWAAP